MRTSGMNDVLPDEAALWQRLQGLHGKAQAPVWYRNLKIKPLE